MASTTADRPTRPPEVEGPVADALGEIDAAAERVDDARRDLVARKEAMATAIRRLRATDSGVSEDALMHELYWYAPQVRIRDICAGLDIGQDELRRRVTPLLEETTCRACDGPTVWLRRSRSDRSTPVCETCQEAVRQQAAGPETDPWSRLFGIVGRVVDAVGCDHTLAATRFAASEVGLSESVVVQRVRAQGGYCDCEVLFNVAPW